MTTPPPTPKTKSPTNSVRLALGISIGAAIGVATGNLGLWLALGVVFGCLAMFGFAKGKGK